MNVNGMENEMNHLDLNTNHNLDNAVSIILLKRCQETHLSM